MSWHTLILLGAASLLAAPFACAGADSTPGALTPVPIERVIPEGMVSPTDPAAESVSPNSVSDGTTSTSAPFCDWWGVFQSLKTEQLPGPGGPGPNSTSARRRQGLDRCTTARHGRPNR